MQSPNFVFDKDVPKEDVDPGIKRQILSHSDDIMLVKARLKRVLKAICTNITLSLIHI